MKNVLLLIHDDAGQEARFQAALDIGRAVEGHLTCVDVSIMPVAIETGYPGDTAFAMLLDDEQQREAVNRTRMEARLSHEDIPWTWVDATGSLASCLRNESRLADLIVVNRQLDQFPLPDMRDAAGELIVRSKAPILAVPDKLARLDLDSALVAWDGSAAAAVALRAAIPLLRLANRVAILEIADASTEVPAEAAAAYLSRHGIRATVVRVPREGKVSTADILLGQASAGGFGYVVMGGFGHRRFAEAMFGGVSRLMLTKSPLPLFLAH